MVYKNIEVLEIFFSHFKLNNTKIVVVNSFYDDITAESCEKIANENHADFINIENHGYGYGNNRGIEYALNNYTFEYLVVSNSDIIIKNFEDLDTRFSQSIIAPKIKNIKGKNQNPNLPWKTYLYFKFLKLGYLKNNELYKFIAHSISRLNREMFLFFSKVFPNRTFSIYSPHGSFFILSRYAVENLKPLFNEHMFMYLEELHIAERSRIKEIPIIYNPRIRISHLDGGSTTRNRKATEEIARNSYIELIKEFDNL